MANEGRAALGCDRLSVLVRRGGKCRALATSGVDQLDCRSQLVRLLEQLATRCATAEESLWYCDGAADVPDQIERPLQAFLDESHARVVLVVPLREPQLNSNDRPARIIGVLVAERFDASGGDGELRERMAAVADPCGTALNNALVHAHLPLSSLGRLLARLRPLAERRQLPKWMAAIGVVAAVIASLALIPADFDIEARGELQPVRRRDVFASSDGVVSDLLASHARPVKAGEPLVKLRKPELDLELGRVAGEIQTAGKKLAAVQAERLENAPDRTDDKRNIHQLAADEEELKELLKGLETEREILMREQADLVVRSPIDGQPLTWNLEQLLQARPVERGQSLLTVADLNGPWVAELRLPDHRTGHVLAARDELHPDLDVSFALASDPGIEYPGRVSEVAPTTDLDPADSPTVLVTVAFDRREVPGLRPGATVLARIHCGRRAIGYVWLHELFEFIQSHWWW
jgi:multidrug efflux pump subunit AcrA (membrane-fusion protein)